MKLTKSYLRRVINEELNNVLESIADARARKEQRLAGVRGDDFARDLQEEEEDELEEGDDWIQKADKDIEKRGTEGKCTPITKPGCTGRAKALAKTFKKMGRERKAKDHPGKRDY